jgi:hypothetical protein
MEGRSSLCSGAVVSLVLRSRRVASMKTLRSGQADAKASFTRRTLTLAAPFRLALRR